MKVPKRTLQVGIAVDKMDRGVRQLPWVSRYVCLDSKWLQRLRDIMNVPLAGPVGVITYEENCGHFNSTCEGVIDGQFGGEACRHARLSNLSA